MDPVSAQSCSSLLQHPTPKTQLPNDLCSQPMLLNVLQEAGDIDLQNERTPSHYTPVPESLSFALIHIDLPTW